MEDTQKNGDHTVMRFFKHGDVLAISLPESLRKKFGITQDDDYEFQEWADGSLTLVKKKTEPKKAIGIEKIGRPLNEIRNNISGSGTFEKNLPQKNAPCFSATGTLLDKQGFMVLINEEQAKAFSHRFESQIKNGDIKGIRGFDKKYYVASRPFVETFADKMLLALKEPKTAGQMALLLKQPEDGINTLLYLLKEEGEIIEKKRGLFIRVL